MRKQIIAPLLPDSAVLCSHSTSTLMDQCGLGYNNGAEGGIVKRHNGIVMSTMFCDSHQVYSKQVVYTDVTVVCFLHTTCRMVTCRNFVAQ